MNRLRHRYPLLRTLLATGLVALLGACTVVPAGYPGYRSSPVYVEGYSAYRPPPGTRNYYESDYRGHDHRAYERRYDDRPSRSMPLPPPLQLHRDLRRSLGLPRLPGMP